MVLRGPHGRDGWSPLWAACGQVPCGRSRPCGGGALQSGSARPLLGLWERSEAQPAFPQPPVRPGRLPSPLRVSESLSLNNPGSLLTFLRIPTPAYHRNRGKNSKTVLITTKTTNILLNKRRIPPVGLGLGIEKVEFGWGTGAQVIALQSWGLHLTRRVAVSLRHPSQGCSDSLLP